MANLADECGTDVEIYVKALTTTIHADTPTGAPHDSTTRSTNSAWSARKSAPPAPSTSGMWCPNISVPTSRSA